MTVPRQFYEIQKYFIHTHVSRHAKGAIVSNPKTNTPAKRKTNPDADLKIEAVGNGFAWDPPDEIFDRSGTPIDQKNIEPTQIVRERKIPRDTLPPVPRAALAAAQMGVEPGNEPIDVRDESVPPRAPSPPKLADDTDEAQKPKDDETVRGLANQEFVREAEERLFEGVVEDADMSAIFHEKTDVSGEPDMSESQPVPFVMAKFSDEPEGFVERLLWLLKFPLRAFRFLQNVGNAGMDAAAALEMAQSNRSAVGSLKFTTENEKQANIDGFAALRIELVQLEQRVYDAAKKAEAAGQQPDTKPALFKDVWALGQRLISRDEQISKTVTAVQKQYTELTDELERLKKTYFANPENVKSLKVQLAKRDTDRYEVAQKIDAFVQRFGGFLSHESLMEAFVTGALPDIMRLIGDEQRRAWNKLAEDMFGEMDKFSKEWKLDMDAKREDARLAIARAKEDLMAVKEGSEIFVPLAEAAVEQAHTATMDLTKKIDEARALKLTDAAFRNLIVEAVDDYLVAKIMNGTMPVAVVHEAPKPNIKKEIPEVKSERKPPKPPEEWTDPVIMKSWTDQPVQTDMSEEPITDPMMKRPEMERADEVREEADVFMSVPPRVGMPEHMDEAQAIESASKPEQAASRGRIILDLDDEEAVVSVEKPTPSKTIEDVLAEAITQVPEEESGEARVEAPLEQLMEHHMKAQHESGHLHVLPDLPPPAAEAHKPAPPLANLASAMRPPMFSKGMRNACIGAACLGLFGFTLSKSIVWVEGRKDRHELQEPHVDAPELVVTEPEAKTEPETAKSETPQAAPEQVQPPEESMEIVVDQPSKREIKTPRTSKVKQAEELDEFGLPMGTAVEKKKTIQPLVPKVKKKEIEVDEMGLPRTASAAEKEPHANRDRVGKQSYANRLSEFLGGTVTIKKVPVELDEDGLPKNMARPEIRSKGNIEVQSVPTPRLKREGE